MFRRYQHDGAWAQVSDQLRALADRQGLITWELNIDTTTVRAHQHAAGAA